MRPLPSLVCPRAAALSAWGWRRTPPQPAASDDSGGGGWGWGNGFGAGMGVGCVTAGVALLLTALWIVWRDGIPPPGPPLLTLPLPAWS